MNDKSEFELDDREAGLEWEPFGRDIIKRAKENATTPAGWKKEGWVKNTAAREIARDAPGKESVIAGGEVSDTRKPKLNVQEVRDWIGQEKYIEDKMKPILDKMSKLSTQGKTEVLDVVKKYCGIPFWEKAGNEAKKIDTPNDPKHWCKMPDLQAMKQNSFADNSFEPTEHILTLAGLNEEEQSSYTLTKALVLCYVNVGELPTSKITAKLDEIKKGWGKTLMKSLPITHPVIFIPINDDNTRIEILNL